MHALPFRPSPEGPARIPVLLRAAGVLLLVLLAFALRLLLLGAGPGEPWLFFVPAVLGSALAFGRAGTILAALLGAVLGLWFFVAPVGSLRVGHAGDLPALLLFLAVSAALGAIAEAARRARREAAVARGWPRYAAVPQQGADRAATGNVVPRPERQAAD